MAQLTKYSFIFICFFSLIGCSSTPSDPKDPLESINRPLWDFTWNYADKYVAKPASSAYT